MYENEYVLGIRSTTPAIENVVKSILIDDCFEL